MQQLQAANQSGDTSDKTTIIYFLMYICNVAVIGWPIIQYLLVKSPGEYIEKIQTAFKTFMYPKGKGNNNSNPETDLPGYSEQLGPTSRISDEISVSTLAASNQNILPANQQHLFSNVLFTSGSIHSHIFPAPESSALNSSATNDQPDFGPRLGRIPIADYPFSHTLPVDPDRKNLNAGSMHKFGEKLSGAVENEAERGIGVLEILQQGGRSEPLISSASPVTWA